MQLLWKQVNINIVRSTINTKKFFELVTVTQSETIMVHQQIPQDIIFGAGEMSTIDTERMRLSQFSIGTLLRRKRPMLDQTMETNDPKRPCFQKKAGCMSLAVWLDTKHGKNGTWTSYSCRIEKCWFDTVKNSWEKRFLRLNLQELTKLKLLLDSAVPQLAVK